MPAIFRRSRAGQTPAAPAKDAFRVTIEGIQGAISVPQARLLRRMARAAQEGVIVEVGSFRGRSTAALSIGSREGRNLPVYAIDPHEEFEGPFGGKFGPNDRRVFYETMLRMDGWRNVRLVNLSSEVIAPGWDKPVALLWIDGDHRYEGVKRDFDCWYPHLVKGGTIIFDDTNRGGPQQLVEELIAQGWQVTHEVSKVRALVEAT